MGALRRTGSMDFKGVEGSDPPMSVVNDAHLLGLVGDEEEVVAPVREGHADASDAQAVVELRQLREEEQQRAHLRRPRVGT